MSIPDLTEHGLLPDGVHDATLTEIEARFGSANDRRRELFSKLSSFCRVLAGLPFANELFADGSFVTDKPSPGDIDAVLETPLKSFASMLNAMAPGSPLNPAVIKATFEVHLFGQFAQSAPWGMVVFFQRMRPEEALSRTVSPSHRRGIVRVVR